jgi:E3 ubiquitin-protein ligase RNF14
MQQDELQEQLDELQALRAIFLDDFTLLDHNETTLKLNLTVNFTQKGVLIGNDELNLVLDGQVVLPPMTLVATVPKDYPQKSCLKSVELHCIWLSQVQRSQIVQHLMEMWMGEAILFTWATHLKTADALIQIGVIKDDLILLSDSLSDSLVHELTSWYETVKGKQFESKDFDCVICFSQTKGIHSIVYPCSHAGCKNCVRNYIVSRMQENRPDNVACPLCSETTLSCTQISEILGDEYPRFQQLLETKQFEARKDVVWCPRAWCHGPAFRDASLDKLVICRDCQYSFCAVCLKSYHGKAFCNLPALLRIVEEYLTAKESGIKKEISRIEAKYGTKMLQRLEYDYLAEKETNEWKKRNTTACPMCHTSIERSEGCNHMTCSTCSTHFCFLCGCYLNKDKPYLHFNSLGSPCNQRLFEGSINVPPRDDQEDGENGVDGGDGDEEIAVEHLAWAFGM